MGSETKRIHFLIGVEDHGDAYRCKRCGHVTSTLVEMNEHRSGIITPCERSRFRQWIYGVFA